jgi:hypothetical protein
VEWESDWQGKVKGLLNSSIIPPPPQANPSTQAQAISRSCLLKTLVEGNRGFQRDLVIVKLSIYVSKLARNRNINM